MIDRLSADYELECVLGNGSFGVVLYGRCLETKKDVAIKVIRNFRKNHYKLKKIVSEVQILR